MKIFRLFSWNVRASMTERVLAELCSDPAVDVFVLSEYRVPKAGDLIRDRLATAGWTYSFHASMPRRERGVAIYAKLPLIRTPELVQNSHPGGHDLSQWIVPTFIPSAGLTVVGVYMPFPDGPLKEAIWETLIDIAIRHQRSRLLIAGDFNSCYPHEADSGRGYTVEPLRRMASVAVDVWREKVPAPSHRDQITWNGPNGLGNRIDFVFATKRLARDIISARHRHDVRERRISDHSAVVVDVRPVAKAQDARMVAVDRAL